MTFHNGLDIVLVKWLLVLKFHKSQIFFSQFFVCSIMLAIIYAIMVLIQFGKMAAGASNCLTPGDCLGE